MKVYYRHSSEGLKPLVGYICDNCMVEVRGEDLPKDWLESLTILHYCPDCIVDCEKCKKTFSINHAEDWFWNKICEDCQEQYFKRGEIK